MLGYLASTYLQGKILTRLLCAYLILFRMHEIVHHVLKYNINSIIKIIMQCYYIDCDREEIRNNHIIYKVNEIANKFDYNNYQQLQIVQTFLASSATL